MRLTRSARYDALSRPPYRSRHGEDAIRRKREDDLARRGDERSAVFATPEIPAHAGSAASARYVETPIIGTGRSGLLAAIRLQ